MMTAVAIAPLVSIVTACWALGVARRRTTGRNSRYRAGQTHHHA